MVPKGEVAIAIIWDYLGLSHRDDLKGKPNLQVLIPSDGSIAGPYVSIINKTAPHPYAARLWIVFRGKGRWIRRRKCTGVAAGSETRVRNSLRGRVGCGRV